MSNTSSITPIEQPLANNSTRINNATPELVLVPSSKKLTGLLLAIVTTSSLAIADVNLNQYENLYDTNTALIDNIKKAKQISRKEAIALLKSIRESAQRERKEIASAESRKELFEEV